MDASSSGAMAVDVKRDLVRFYMATAIEYKRSTGTACGDVRREAMFLLRMFRSNHPRTLFIVHFGRTAPPQ